MKTNIFNIGKTVDRMNAVMNNALEGRNTEMFYDETRISSLESKLNRYLTITKQKTQRMEEERDHIKSLISDISHQTKTPIANISLYGQLLSEAEDIPTEAKQYIAELNRQTGKLAFLVEALVKLSRLETGIIAANLKRTNVLEMLNRVISDVRPFAEAKEISIAMEGAKGIGETELGKKGEDSADEARRMGAHSEDLQRVEAHIDEKWTAEAFKNILDNAVKYTPIAGKISICVESLETFVKVDITDTGMGIITEEIPKIFGRFYRSADAAGAEGLGLGLHLAREILEKEGGYIRVRSKQGIGSTFTVFLSK